MNTPRQRFLDYVRRVHGAAPIVSPFLPKPELLEKTLRALHLPVSQDPVADEIRVARALDYEPMFMIDLHEPLKTLGVFRVPIRLHAEVKPEIKVWVIKQ